MVKFSWAACLGEKLEGSFFVYLIVMEIYLLMKDMIFFSGWSNSHGRPVQVKNLRIFFNIALIIIGNQPIDERYEEFFFQIGLILMGDLPR